MVRDRYHIGCSYCGFLQSTPTQRRAFDVAWYAQRLHSDCGSVTVFDAMAHYGRPQLWDANGSVQRIREED